MCRVGWGKSPGRRERKEGEEGEEGGPGNIRRDKGGEGKGRRH